MNRLIALLPACLLLAGCAHPHQPAATPRDLVRWAVADKNQIESAINTWSERKIAEAQNAEALSPQETEQLRHYEDVERQWTEFLTQRNTTGIDPTTGRPRLSAKDTAQEQELQERLSQARAPIAQLLDRREHQAAQFRNQYNAQQLTAEYAKARFDLVIDSSEMHYLNTPVLYRRPGEALDITEGILQLFQEKTKP